MKGAEQVPSHPAAAQPSSNGCPDTGEAKAPEHHQQSRANGASREDVDQASSVGTRQAAKGSDSRDALSLIRLYTILSLCLAEYHLDTDRSQQERSPLSESGACMPGG